MNFRNLKISTRLGLAFALTLFIMLLMAAFSTSRLNTIADSNRQILDKNAVGVAVALEIAVIIQENGSRTLELFITADQAARSKNYAAIDINKKKITALLETLNRLVESPREKQTIQKLNESRAAFVAAFGKTADLLELDQRDEAAAMMGKTTFPALNLALNNINTLIDIQKQDMAKNGDAIKADIAFSRTLTLVLGLLAVLLSSACAYWVTRSITLPLGEAIQVAERVADGDLTANIVVSSKDETGQLLNALAHMNQSLVSTISQVHSSSETIYTASGEIASGNADLSARTESQASSLEQTASSMEELTSAVKQSADNARQANQLVMSASEIASKGGGVVEQVVTTMGSIKLSSGKIVEIISVIDGIAFQTNILALNAAVEAARAGEQGRGFAVVASEVRNLAQRSASAAKEIKSLIDDSVSKVDQGNRLVNEAGQAMSDIVSSVRHVAAFMREIATASQEQSSGIEQVNLAISHMDEMTQQNAALVEQAAAAAESMREQTGALTQAVSVFKLNGDVDATRISLAAATPIVSKSSVRMKTELAPARPAPVRRLAGGKLGAAAQATQARPAASEDDWEEF